MAAGRWIYIRIMIITSVLMAGVLTGCQGKEPDNLEPLLDIADVSGITRTEAIITASIQKQGPGNLTFLSLYYGEPGDVPAELKLPDLDAEIHTIHLRELKAGTTYECYIAGGYRYGIADVARSAVYYNTQ